MKTLITMCVCLALTCTVLGAQTPASLSSSSTPTIEKAKPEGPEGAWRPRMVGTLDEGGETCASAFAIVSLPYNDIGYTCDNVNDYDFACPYTGSTAKDVVYSYAPTQDEYVTFSLCNSYYDTKLYIYQDVCQNPPLYCNDDACSGPNYPDPYLSKLECVLLSAGHTYYIVVDGYGTDCGNYVLDVAVCPPPAPRVCPEDALFSQPPYGPNDWAGTISDDQFPNLVFDNFAGVNAPICDIHFWGLSLVWDGNWYPCDEDPMPFEIKFYANNDNGLPGNVVCSYSLLLTRQLVGQWTWAPLYYWSATLDTCCQLSSGWVSIQGLSAGLRTDCMFGWMGSPTGDGAALEQDASGALYLIDYDFAFCLTPGETPPEMDLGDIIHPANSPNGYPTLPANPGHILSNIAWLGAGITGEAVPNVFDLDPADDGVAFPRYMIPCTQVSVVCTVTAGPNYATHPLYLNAWKDGNDDGDFCDVLCPVPGAVGASEWIIQNASVWPGVHPFTFTDPGLQNVPPYTGWFRFRLTSVPVGQFGFGLGGLSSWNCQGTYGVDELGEVEDYWFEDYQLAVELGSFDAIAGAGEVALTWVTASETANDYFELLRDGVLIAQVPTLGNDPDGHAYQYVDRSVDNGVTYSYTLASVDLAGSREELAVRSATPSFGAGTATEYALYQNYPNPFNAVTTFAFDLKETAVVSLKLYNMTGQAVATVVSGEMAAGRHEVSFDASGLPTGMYLYRLDAPGFTMSKKMLLIK